MGVDHDPRSTLDEPARSQHGLVTSQQAVQMLGPYRKARWVTQRRLVMVQPGVFRLAGAPQSWHQSLDSRLAWRPTGSCPTGQPLSCGD